MFFLSGTQRKKINWERYLFSKSKNPYGTYAFTQYLTKIFQDTEFSRTSFRELLNDNYTVPAFLSISENFDPTVLETNLILERVAMGDNFFISARQYNYHFLDTLKLNDSFSWEYVEMKEYEKDFDFSLNQFFNADTVHLKPVNPNYVTSNQYIIRERDQNTHFNAIDTLNTTVLAVNSAGNAVAVKVYIGRGSLVLSTTPYMFTNVYFLYGENESFVRYLLSYLPVEKVHLTEFYELGRDESKTPLRYVLSQVSLKYAIYILVGLLVIFVLFEAKRKQRVIPELEPPKNSTLEFVKTIGNLYFENKGNRAIAEKRYQFFIEQVRKKFFIDIHNLDKEMALHLHKKSGAPVNLITSIFDRIKFIKTQSDISEEYLEKLSNEIDVFYQYI